VILQKLEDARLMEPLHVGLTASQRLPCLVEEQPLRKEVDSVSPAPNHQDVVFIWILVDILNKNQHVGRFAKTGALTISMVVFGSITHAQCRVALVNMQEVVTSSNEAKVLNEKFNDRVREWNAKLDLIRSEVFDLELKLKGKNGIPNKAYAAELSRTRTEKNHELTQATKDAQKDVDKYRGSLLAITTSAFETAKLVAAEKGMVAVIDSSSPTTTAPINGDTPNCDITTELKTRMNAKLSTAVPLAK